MRRTRSVSVVATLVMALAPAAASAQAEPAEEIAPYAVCASGGGQTTCQVTNKVDREDLELTRDPSSPDDVFSPDEQEPARLICGEGQRGCVVADELITPEDIRDVFPEAEDLHIFNAQSDANPVGNWQVTFDDTVATCVLYGTEVQDTEVSGGTFAFIIERQDDGTMAWKFFSTSGALLKLGWGTYGLMDVMAAGPWRDVDYMAMVSEDAFTGTVVGTSADPECTRNWNFEGVRSK